MDTKLKFPSLNEKNLSTVSIRRLRGHLKFKFTNLSSSAVQLILTIEQKLVQFVLVFFICFGLAVSLITLYSSSQLPSAYA